jgi:hypothetical protein
VRHAAGLFAVATDLDVDSHARVVTPSGGRWRGARGWIRNRRFHGPVWGYVDRFGHTLSRRQPRVEAFLILWERETCFDDR